MIKVTAVKPYPNYRLLVTILNGENKYLDMRPYLHYPVFRKLENHGFLLWRQLTTAQ